MNNINEFNRLIECYETIQLDEINSVWLFRGRSSAFYLTGFGTCETCSLCQAVNDDLNEVPYCNMCVYSLSVGCSHDEMSETYFGIKLAQTPEELLQAYRNRAKAMREFLNNKLEENETK